MTRAAVVDGRRQERGQHRGDLRARTLRILFGSIRCAWRDQTGQHRQQKEPSSGSQYEHGDFSSEDA
jgi:hypothetical protein